MYVIAISVFVGLVTCNFVWQAFMKRKWGVAAERSFFQAVALGAYLLAAAIH